MSKHEVNTLLDRYHDDTAQPRRRLAEAGLLARDHGRYWVPSSDEARAEDA